MTKEGYDALLRVCQRAYRKHYTDDPEIGWEQLGEEMSDALEQAMGADEFNKWLDNISGTEATKA